MKNRIMTHVVAGYPSPDDCVELMLGMQKAGIGMIEVQIPFSDPIADGETIMRANDSALALGISTKKGFDLIRRARREGFSGEVYIMSYAQKLVSCGFENFCREAAEVEAKGLIVPDLPFDSPEYKELSKAASAHSLDIVPVVSPGMDEQRLKKDLGGKSGLVYLTSMKGITGNKLRFSDELKDLCRSVRKISPDSRVAIGFGIRDKKGADEVLATADVAVVGSSVIRKVDESGVKGALKFIESLS